MEADLPSDAGGVADIGERPEGYLRTILTYNLPSEAEVDKAFLESHGIAVCLLNANTSRNELGAPFFVRLQVMEGEVERACQLIAAVNPKRFGSLERVGEIDRQIKRALARLALIALPFGIVVGLATYLLAARLAAAQPMYVHRFWVTPNIRVELSIFVGLAATVLAATLKGKRQA